MVDSMMLMPGFSVRRKIGQNQAGQDLFAVGRFLEDIGDGRAKVDYSSDPAAPVIFATRYEELELWDLTERQALQLLRFLGGEKSRLSKEFEAAKSAYAQAEEALMKILNDADKDGTALYDGLGRAVFADSRVFASIPKDAEQEAFEGLRAIGRGEVIKEGVNAATLSSLVGELIDKGTEVPKGISYYVKQVLALRAK